jgi:hypothetical protein
MRTICLLAILALIALGCAKNESDVPSERQQSEAASGERDHAGQPEVRGSETSAGDPTSDSGVDPAFREYEYPGAELDGMMPMGNAVSVAYRTGDGLATVVEHYQQSLDTVEITDSHAYFSKDTPDGALTVTLTPVGDLTQIILRMDKKQ